MINKKMLNESKPIDVYVYVFKSNNDASAFHYDLEDNCGSVVNSRVENGIHVIADGNNAILDDWRNDNRVVSSCIIHIPSLSSVFGGK